MCCNCFLTTQWEKKIIDNLFAWKMHGFYKTLKI